MRFPVKITSSCIWVAIPVDRVILHRYASGADGRSPGRAVYGHVITKFSRMGSLPHFLTHGAPFRALRARAPLLFLPKHSGSNPVLYSVQCPKLAEGVVRTRSCCLFLVCLYSVHSICKSVLPISTSKTSEQG